MASWVDCWQSFRTGLIGCAQLVSRFCVYVKFCLLFKRGQLFKTVYRCAWTISPSGHITSIVDPHPTHPLNMLRPALSQLSLNGKGFFSHWRVYKERLLARLIQPTKHMVERERGARRQQKRTRDKQWEGWKALKKCHLLWPRLLMLNEEMQGTTIDWWLVCLCDSVMWLNEWSIKREANIFNLLYASFLLPLSSSIMIALMTQTVSLWLYLSALAPSPVSRCKFEHPSHSPGQNFPLSTISFDLGINFQSSMDI